MLHKLQPPTNAARTTDSAFIPNSFQTPNAYIDRYLHLLTGEEFKILAYAMRRIFGFNKRSDAISVSQFCTGVTAQDGTQLDHGTGLQNRAVIRALAELKRFGFIVEETPADPARHIAPTYRLELDSNAIDMAALEARAAEQRTANKARTSRAAAVRQTNRENPDRRASDEPRAVRQTNRETPIRRASDAHTIDQLETQLETQDESPRCETQRGPARAASACGVEKPTDPDLEQSQDAPDTLTATPTLESSAPPPAPPAAEPIGLETDPPDSKRKQPAPAVIRQALYDACAIQPGISTRERIIDANRSALKLWQAGQKAGKSDDEIADTIAYVANYCQRHAWECKPLAGTATPQRPTPKTIRDYWRQAIEARAAVRTRATPPPQAAQPEQPRRSGAEIARMFREAFEQQNASGSAPTAPAAD